MPLLASGAALLVDPSDGSFAAYAHLIVSVWWTVLLIWHLRRYMVSSLRVTLKLSTATGLASRARR